MHVSILGAGALGRIYGLRLTAAGEHVSFVVRPARAEERAPFEIERVNGDRRRDVLERPRRVTAIPAEADVVLVAVRFDQIEADPSIAATLRAAPRVPVVTLTPLLPGPRAALEHAIGRPVVPGMPSASGYVDDRGVVRYWITGVAWTLLDDGDAGARMALDQLARRLDRAGLHARLASDVAALNLATTTGFFPLVAAVGAGGGVEGALADTELLETAIAAAKECDALAQRLGKAAPWSHLLTRFVGPYTLRPAAALAKRAAPEAVRFVDVHFGPKLRAQHLAMGAGILALGVERGESMPALGRLMDRVRAA
jgi:2-dehydropantoate 2-reductase